MDVFEDDVLAPFRNKIICGDILDIIRKILDGSIDLEITSPPYNLKNSTVLEFNQILNPMLVLTSVV